MPASFMIEWALSRGHTNNTCFHDSSIRCHDCPCEVSLHEAGLINYLVEVSNLKPESRKVQAEGLVFCSWVRRSSRESEDNARQLRKLVFSYSKSEDLFKKWIYNSLCFYL